MRNYYKVTTITYFSSSIPSYPAGVSGPLNLCITSEMFGSSFCAVMITSLDHDVQISIAAPPVIIFSSEPPQAQGRVSLAGTVCFYALFVILHKIKYLLSNKLFINVLSLFVLMPRPWSHFAPFFVTVTTEQINTTVILIFYNNHIYMQHLFFS